MNRSIARSFAQPLVSTSWLAQNLENPSVVVLDGSWHFPQTGLSSRKDFEDIRIKGARFFNIEDARDKSSPFPITLPSEKDFASHVGGLGVANSNHVVIYDAAMNGAVPRVLWMFRAFGHNGGVSILEGGLPKWRQEGLPTETGPPKKFEPKPYTAKLNKLIIRSFEDVRENITSTRASMIVDARPAGRFKGVDPEPKPNLPSGHMPSAVSLPAPTLLEPTTKSIVKGSELAARFSAAGVDVSKPTIHTCAVGVMACSNWLAQILTRMAKASPESPKSWEELEEGLAVYDGSWTEWVSKNGEVVKEE